MTPDFRAMCAELESHCMTIMEQTFNNKMLKIFSLQTTRKLHIIEYVSNDRPIRY